MVRLWADAVIGEEGVRRGGGGGAGGCGGLVCAFYVHVSEHVCRLCMHWWRVRQGRDRDGDRDRDRDRDQDQDRHQDRDQLIISDRVVPPLVPRAEGR